MIPATARAGHGNIRAVEGKPALDSVTSVRLYVGGAAETRSPLNTTSVLARGRDRYTPPSGSCETGSREGRCPVELENVTFKARRARAFHTAGGASPCQGIPREGPSMEYKTLRYTPREINRGDQHSLFDLKPVSEGQKVAAGSARVRCRGRSTRPFRSSLSRCGWSGGKSRGANAPWDSS